MSVSQGNISLGPIGLTLLAWAEFNGDTGAIIKGYNIAAATHTATSGSYAVTFTAAVASANYVVTIAGGERSGATGQTGKFVSSPTTAGFTLTSTQPGLGNIDLAGSVHMAVWG